MAKPADSEDVELARLWCRNPRQLACTSDRSCGGVELNPSQIDLDRTKAATRTLSPQQPGTVVALQTGTVSA